MALRQLIYFQNAAGKVFEHPEGYAYVQMAASMARESREITALIAHTSRLLLLRNWHRLLADQQLMLPLHREEKKWLVDYWLPGKVDRPERIILAAVVPTDKAAQQATRQLWREVPPTYVEYHGFERLAEAQAFLEDLAPELW